MSLNASSSSTEFASYAAAVLGGPIITEPATLLSGQNLTALTAVGRITASGKIQKAIQTATDGSQVVIGFITQAVHADGADAACQIYKGGRINKTLATIDASYTAAMIAGMFDGTPITLETPTRSADKAYS